MRNVSEKEIISAVKELFIKANYELTDDVSGSIEKCRDLENSDVAKNVLCRICDNLAAAKELSVPICQDTGMAVVFAKIGNEVHIESGRSFGEIINDGVSEAYTEGYLRMSIVKDPLRRVNTENNTPAICYTSIVPGNKIEITAAPKGFGSENMSKIKMFTPTSTREDIIEFVTETVKTAGSNPCPPIVIGVGIGGSFDYCAVLAKKALTRRIDERNADPFYAEMEEDILKSVNSLGIGPQGFGGDTTALAVNIETYPTHIAGLPVAVNINCHVCRHRTVVI